MPACWMLGSQLPVDPQLVAWKEPSGHWYRQLPDGTVDLAPPDKTSQATSTPATPRATWLSRPRKPRRNSLSLVAIASVRRPIFPNMANLPPVSNEMVLAAPANAGTPGDSPPHRGLAKHPCIMMAARPIER